MNKKIAFFDIDGTMIDCSEGITEPTEKTKRALEILRDEGYYIGIATGRPKLFIPDRILKNINPDVLITSNGSYIEVEGKEIYNNLIDKKVLDEFRESCNKYKIKYILEGQNQCISVGMSEKEIENFSRKFSLKSGDIVDYRRKQVYKANKLVVFLDTKEKIEIIKDKFSFCLNLLRHGDLDSYDLYNRKCSKGSGVKATIEYLGIDIKNTLAFGDDLNDLEMLQLVDVGVAMGEGNSELIRKVNYTTGSVKEEGIYNFLVKMLDK